MLAMFAVMLRFALIAPSSVSGGEALSVARPAVDDLVHDPIVLSFFRVLVRQARLDRDAEQAAFIVRTPEGALYFVWWPARDERNSVQWRGPLPDGVIAIVHTHPAWLPMPSKLDRTTASRTRMPVYVVTPFLIVKTTGGPSEVVIAGEKAW